MMIDAGDHASRMRRLMMIHQNQAVPLIHAACQTVNVHAKSRQHAPRLLIRRKKHNLRGNPPRSEQTLHQHAGRRAVHIRAVVAGDDDAACLCRRFAQRTERLYSAVHAVPLFC